MKTHLIKASVQYNDEVGTVALDFKEPMDSFLRFVESKGFDSKTYYPYAYSFEYLEAFLEPLNINKDEAYFFIHAVSKEDFAESLSGIIKKLQEGTETIPTYKFSFKIKANELFAMFKRFKMTFALQIRNEFERHLDDSYGENVIKEIELK